MLHSVMNCYKKTLDTGFVTYCYNLFLGFHALFSLYYSIIKRSFIMILELLFNPFALVAWFWVGIFVWSWATN